MAKFLRKFRFCISIFIEPLTLVDSLGSNCREVFERIWPCRSKRLAPCWHISQDHYAIHQFSLERVFDAFGRGLGFVTLDILLLLVPSLTYFVHLCSMVCSQLHKLKAFVQLRLEALVDSLGSSYREVFERISIAQKPSVYEVENRPYYRGEQNK
jgi:hypothetical protein